jgi:peptidase M50B-like protein
LSVGLLILGYSLGLLWLFVILLALLLLQIRNFYGFAVIVGVAVALIAISWYASATIQSTLAYLLTWILLISAPKPVIELIGQRRRRRGRHSDADQLSRLTRTPATLWALLFLVVNLAGLVVGTALLLPALAQLAVGAAHQLAAR